MASPQKPLFVTFEGGDGSGKSTQVRLLQQALQVSGIRAIASREPGGTPQAERIRQFIIQRDSGYFDPLTEALLMFAARREHLVDKIWPALKSDEWVISDRFADSTRAFQGYGMGLDLAAIEKIYTVVMGDFQPDLTFIFDIDPEEGLKRSGKRAAETCDATEATEDKYERLGLGFQKKLRQGFLEIAAANPGRCVVVDASRSIADIHASILEVIQKRTGQNIQAVSHG